MSEDSNPNPNPNVHKNFENIGSFVKSNLPTEQKVNNAKEKFFDLFNLAKNYTSQFFMQPTTPDGTNSKEPPPSLDPSLLVNKFRGMINVDDEIKKTLAEQFKKGDDFAKNFIKTPLGNGLIKLSQIDPTNQASQQEIKNFLKNTVGIPNANDEIQDVKASLRPFGTGIKIIGILIMILLMVIIYKKMKRSSRDGKISKGLGIKKRFSFFRRKK